MDVCASRSGMHDDDSGARYASAASTTQEVGQAATDCERAEVNERLGNADRLYLVSE
jgi:hypothetical protein